MAYGDLIKSTPGGALMLVSEDERGEYIKRIFELPQGVSEIVFAPRTGAYLRGLVSSYKLPLTKSHLIALAIVRLFIGKKSLAQLPGILSTELGLANDAAQKMASEIEDDLLAPVMGDLKKYWARNKDGLRQDDKKSIKTSPDMPNVLNLKEKDIPPAPPWQKSN
jgi:hypothetical protein